MDKLLIKRDTVIIRRTSWKNDNAFEITSGEVSYDKLNRCIDTFKTMGMVEVEFSFDVTDKMYVNALGTRLHYDA